MTGVGEQHQPVAEWHEAQAVEFVQALRRHLGEMTSRLAWVDRQASTASKARPVALRGEASVLRRDIQAARVLIGRLERTYLAGGDTGTDPRRPRDPRVGAADN